jgi:hypothetical protein
VNETMLKATLKALLAEVENLTASQAVLIQTLRGMSKGTVSVSDVQSAIAQAKVSNQKHFEKWRKNIDEI